MIFRKQSTHGVALIIMIWAVGLLSATVLGLAVYLQSGLDEDAARAKAYRARQLAESGLAVAMHPDVSKIDPLLRQQLSSAEQFSVEILSEGARANINQLLQDEESMALQNLFERWGMELEAAELVIDCLRDWVDPDDLTRLSGMENKGYVELGLPDLPRNQPFRSVEEMALCNGMDLVERVQPRWQDYFTIWGDGSVDVNDANLDILVAVGGLDELQAESLIESRAGPDGELLTEDDLEFESIEQVRSFLGYGQQQFDAVAGSLSTGSQVTRIRSTGSVSGLSRTISALVNSGSGGQGKIIALYEE